MSGETVKFQRVIDVKDYDSSAIILRGFSRSFGDCRHVGLELIIVNRKRSKALSVNLDPREIEEILKSILEFAGAIRLGELTKTESE